MFVPAYSSSSFDLSRAARSGEGRDKLTVLYKKETLAVFRCR